MAMVIITIIIITGTFCYSNTCLLPGNALPRIATCPHGGPIYKRARWSRKPFSHASSISHNRNSESGRLYIYCTAPHRINQTSGTKAFASAARAFVRSYVGYGRPHRFIRRDEDHDCCRPLAAFDATKHRRVRGALSASPQPKLHGGRPPRAPCTHVA